MNRLKFGGRRGLVRVAMVAVGAVLAQGVVSAQTSEDKGQAGQKPSDKTGTAIPAKKGNLPTKPTPSPESAQPLALAVTTDKKTITAGTAIKMTLTAKNTTQQTMNLSFGSGQKYDFTLREGVKPDGKIVWQWARGRMFAQMMNNTKLEPGKSLTFTETYAPAAGETLKAGTYTVTATLATFGARPSATTQIIVK